jgi:hypothetical protein
LTEIFFWSAARIICANFVVSLRMLFCRAKSHPEEFRWVERLAGSALFAEQRKLRAK